MKHTARSHRSVATLLATLSTLFAFSGTALGQSKGTSGALSATPAAPAPKSKTDSAAKSATETAALPSAQDIFAKAIEAAGGADLIRSQRSRTQTGTIEMPAASLKGAIVTKSVDPDMLLVETEIPGFGKIRQGINGTIGWSIDPMRGASLMNADEIARILRESSAESELNPALGCESVEVVERTSFSGAPCYKVKFLRGGDGSTRYYSVDSGHLVGSAEVVKSSMGEFEVTTTYKDFGDFSGRTVAKTQENAMAGQTQVLKISVIDFGPIDPTNFALPAEIQTLVDATKTPPVAPPTAPASPTDKSAAKK